MLAIEVIRTSARLWRAPGGAAWCYARLSAVVAGALAAASWWSVGCTFDLDRPWQHDVASQDAPSDASSGPRPDAAPQLAFRLCWTSGMNGEAAVCPPGTYAVAGGASCDTALRAAGATTGNSGWRAECLGPLIGTDVICADRPTAFRRLEATRHGDVVRALCAGDDVVVGGGCICQEPAALVHHTRSLDVEGWSCICDMIGSHHAHAICTDRRTAESLGHSLGQLHGVTQTQVALRCPSGVALAGGCGSDTATLSATYPTDQDGWACIFSGSPASAFIRLVCVTADIRPCS